MNFLTDKMKASPAYARIAPFVIFLILTTCQGQFGDASRYWLYLAKTVVGVWLIWVMWPLVQEMRWKLSWEAVAVGVGIFVVWVGLDPLVPKNHIFFKPTPDEIWNPFAKFGDGTAMAWMFVAVRILGSTFVVPPLEEAMHTMPPTDRAVT